MLTKRLRRIHNAWRSRFKSVLVFKVQWFRFGGGAVHHLTRRYLSFDTVVSCARGLSYS